jgi:hypothetical protein
VAVVSPDEEPDNVVHLEQCTFKDNSADYLIAAYQGASLDKLPTLLDSSPRICQDDADLEVYHG